MKSIRNKIFSGVLFLFLIIIVLSILSVIFINQLAESSEGTITDNYRTIDYTTRMLAALDEMYIYQSELHKPPASAPDSVDIFKYNNAKKIFELNLGQESANITESGEGILVTQLQSDYKSFLNLLRLEQNPGSIKRREVEETYYKIRNIISEIYSLNMSAVIRKNSIAGNRAGEVIIYTVAAGVASIIITLFFLITFPGHIVRPIKDLTEKIKAVSRKEYNQSIEVNTKDEIGQLAEAFNIMALRLKEYESKQIEEILTSQKRLEALVQNMKDGILVLDNNNRIVLANGIMTELCGIKSNEIQNKNITEITAGNDLLRNLTGLLYKNTVWDEIKTLKVVRDQREYYYETELIPIISDHDILPAQNMGTMIILRNVTRYEERDAAKTNLISTVSHEIKTPISSINLVVKLLEDSRVGNLNLEQKELVQSIKEQSNRLSKVVNEILNYSQIETGNIRLSFSDVHPEDIIDYATTALMILLSEKNIQLETEIAENLPVIKIDVEKSIWVLVNLLSNAIRYSKQEGRIILSAGKHGNYIFFSVKDFGPGISEEDQKKLFSRFTYLGRKTERGWGLGLAISKEFVQAQGGSISVESNPGEGSKFTFTLPV